MSENFNFQLRLSKNKHLYSKNQNREISHKNQHLASLKLENDILFEKLKNASKATTHKISYERELQIQSLRDDFRSDLDIFKHNEQVDYLERQLALQAVAAEDFNTIINKLNLSNKELNEENFRLKENARKMEKRFKIQQEEVQRMQINATELRKDISKVHYVKTNYKEPHSNSATVFNLEQELNSKSEQIKLLLCTVERLQLELQDKNNDSPISQYRRKILEEKSKNQKLLNYINSCEQLIYNLVNK
eukprot:NODE_246_length_12992_cov_0.264407.p4 type:complete len:248 gc:universal NODE_246_length_12992_cov_0.264407:11378-10635(-)